MDAGTLPMKELARRKARCKECGRIESIRRTDEHGKIVPHNGSARSAAEKKNRTSEKSTLSEITVRLEDGSSRVMTDADPGRWRLGERVKVIDGLAGPGG
jgi:hypothetical protein